MKFLDSIGVTELVAKLKSHFTLRSETPSPSNSTPSMDGTASAGSAKTYARSDHRHPKDTSKQDKLVSGTNIKTVNGTSLLGNGNITISSGVTDVTLDGTSVVSGTTAVLTSATLTASDDGNGNVTLGLTGIGALSTASGVSF